MFVAGEMMSQASKWLEQQMHPTVIISAFRNALEDVIEILRDQISSEIDITNRDEMLKIVKSCIGTKFIRKWLVFRCGLRYSRSQCYAVRTALASYMHR